MKITLLLLLLILNAIFPDSWLIFPFFVGFCLPLKHKKGIKRYLNISFNIIVVLLILLMTINLLGYFPSSNSKIMFYPKLYKLIDFLFYLPISIASLLVFKFIYKYRINRFDMILHILALLAINYGAEPLAILLIKREHFSAFTLSLHLLFIFHSLYCIWKVDQHEKKNSLEII